MNRFFVVAALVLFLSGCSRHTSYQYLATHPQLLEQVLSRCQAMTVLDASQDQTCVNAENARQEVSRLYGEVATSIQGFGQEIIAAQIKLADLKGQYQKNPSPTLATDIQSQQDEIARMLAICRYVGE